MKLTSAGPCLQDAHFAPIEVLLGPNVTFGSYLWLQLTWRPSMMVGRVLGPAISPERVFCRDTLG